MHCSTTRAPRQQHGTGGPDPCLDPCAAEAHPHGAGKAWRAARLELGSASHIGGASGEDRGNVECPPMRMTAWCPPVLGARADPTPHPSPAGPFVWLPQLRPFGTSGAHRSAGEQKSAIDLRGPLPVTPRNSER